MNNRLNSQKPNKRKRRPLAIWKRTIEIPVLIAILLAGVSLLAVLTLLNPPQPTIIYQAVPSATHVPPNLDQANFTYISSLASATPNFWSSDERSEKRYSGFDPESCIGKAISSDGAFVFRLWLQRSKELYRIDSDGSNVCYLTQDNFVDDHPAWSPDGKKIAFVSTRDGYGIYLMDADGSNKMKLTDGGSAYSFPAWSPDGSQIVFQATIDERFDLYAINVDGTNLRDLTKQPRLDTSPAWSPDGQFIAFASDRTFNSFIDNRLPQEWNYEIYLMNHDGSNAHRLTSNDTIDFFPSWSPDSLRLTFASGWGNIYMINRDGSGLRLLTSGTLPVWSTSGDEIAFIDSSINLMDSDGTHIRQVTDIVGIEYMDYWTP